MAFLNPYGFLALLFVPPVVLLHILKFRRQRKAVSSTMLWQRVIADLRANTPFQKLRRNLPLLLQIIILVLLSLALAQPIIFASMTAEKKYVVLIIDSSASMQSTDAEETRLETAKREAADIIDSLPADAEVMVIEAGDQPQVVGNFTPDHSLSQRAVDGIKPRDSQGKLAEAITLAYNNLMGVRPRDEQDSSLPPGEIFLFSDGGNLALPELKDLGRLLRYIKVGTRGNNVGITAFHARMSPGARDASFTVSARLTSALDADRRVFLSLLGGKEQKLIDTRGVTVPAGGSEFVIFEGKQLDFSQSDTVRLTARIEYPLADRDDLAVDDAAYCVVNKPHPLRVLLVTEGSAAIERYFKTNPATDVKVVASVEYKDSLTAIADLVVFDHFVPGALPQCDCLFIEPLCTLDGTKKLEEVLSPPVTDWLPKDPLFKYVGFDNLLIYTGHPLPTESGDEVLLRTKTGALILRRPHGEFTYLITAFDPHFSTWIYEPGFVIFMENLISAVMSHMRIGVSAHYKAGQPAEFTGNSERVGECEAIAPDGGKLVFTATEGWMYLYDTSGVGFYEVTIIGRDNQPHRRDFGVSTVSRVESMTAPLDGLNLGEDEEIKALKVPRSNLDVWPFLAVAAVLVMLAEWWAFHRKR